MGDGQHGKNQSLIQEAKDFDNINKERYENAKCVLIDDNWIETYYCEILWGYNFCVKTLHYLLDLELFYIKIKE